MSCLFRRSTKSEVGSALTAQQAGSRSIFYSKACTSLECRVPKTDSAPDILKFNPMGDLLIHGHDELGGIAIWLVQELSSVAATLSAEDNTCVCF